MRILIPLDGSPLAEYALGQAANLARHAKEPVELRLLRVISLTSLTLASPEIAIANALSMAEADATEYLHDVVMRSSLHHLNVTTRVVSSSMGMAETISKLANEWHADLILMTSHGRSGVVRALLGSVAREVVSKSQVPTLIFRLPGQAEQSIQAGSFRMLVTLDESIFAERALPPAIRLATMLDATLVLFEVLPSPSADLFYDRELLERAERYLHQQCAKVEEQGVHALMSVSIGDPASQILQCAQEPNNGCDLIVMTTHARTGLDRMFIGSIADEVFRNTHLPLLILHPTDVL